MAENRSKAKLRQAVPVFLVGDIASTIAAQQRHEPDLLHVAPVASGLRTQFSGVARLERADTVRANSTGQPDEAIRWLLEGDPAIRWQTLRDLVGASARRLEEERSKVAREGWGVRLLARQDREGTWAGGRSSDGGLYSPKWTSTTYTMLLLRDFGLPASNPQARRACALLLDREFQRDGGINYEGRRRGETCITGMVLSILCSRSHPFRR